MAFELWDLKRVVASSFRNQKPKKETKIHWEWQKERDWDRNRGRGSKWKKEKERVWERDMGDRDKWRDRETKDRKYLCTKILENVRNVV